MLVCKNSVKHREPRRIPLQNSTSCGVIIPLLPPTIRSTTDPMKNGCTIQPGLHHNSPHLQFPGSNPSGRDRPTTESPESRPNQLGLAYLPPNRLKCYPGVSAGSTGPPRNEWSEGCHDKRGTTLLISPQIPTH